MKKTIIGAVLCLMAQISMAQVISIAEARELPEETVVTVSGVVTNGDELGIIRYFQDGTGGLAAYGPSVEDISRGDSITITGELKDFNGLLEIDPVNSFEIHGPAVNPIEPELVTWNQIGEETEGQLVQLENVTFLAGGDVFAGNNEYAFSSINGEGTIYVRSDHPLIGELVPIGPVTLVGISTQFTFTGFDGYQLIARDEDDIFSPNPINIISSIDIENQNNFGFTLNWSTDAASTSEAFFTDAIDGSGLESNHVVNSVSTTDHSLELSGLNPGDVYFVQIFSVAGEDTAFSNVTAYATVSETGNIEAYFNRSVNNDEAEPSSNLAVQTNLKDSIVAYINRAQSTLDLAIYNTNNSEIINAVNDAYDRGVEVRYIAEGQNANIGLSSLVDDIPIQIRQNADGSGMHNKFVVVDYQDSDSSYVLTGATNFTNNNLFSDANNLVIIQDRALAKSYRIEFNEMWGSTGLVPNDAESRFGEDKINNTPEKFIIDGSEVELYFSPSDGTTAAIANALETADASIDFALLLITQNMLADILIESSFNFFLTVDGIVNDVNSSGSDFDEMVSEGVNVIEHTFESSLHHKYAIVDADDLESDPLVITGSHNWTASAGSVNDENTLIIHDAAIANQFYQEFSARYDELTLSTEDFIQADLKLFPNPANDRVTLEFEGKGSPAEIGIFSIDGKQVDRLVLDTFIGLNRLELGVNNLPEGVYLIHFNDESSRGVQKLSVVR